MIYLFTVNIALLTSIDPVTDSIEHDSLLPVSRDLVEQLGVLARLEVDVVLHHHHQAALRPGHPDGGLQPALLARCEAQPHQRVA